MIRMKGLSPARASLCHQRSKVELSHVALRILVLRILDLNSTTVVLSLGNEEIIS